MKDNSKSNWKKEIENREINIIESVEDNSDYIQNEQGDLENTLDEIIMTLIIGFTFLNILIVTSVLIAGINI